VGTLGGPGRSKRLDHQLAIIVWAVADLPFSAVPGNGRLAPHPLQSYLSSPMISIKSKVILALPNRQNYSGIWIDVNLEHLDTLTCDTIRK